MMMLLQGWNCYKWGMGVGSLQHHNLILIPHSGNIIPFFPIRRRRRRKTENTTDSSSNSSICVSRVGIEDIADIAHNKVLVATALSAAIGQFSKPFTSAILYGRNNNNKTQTQTQTRSDTTSSSISNFNFRSVFQAGGFPSSHSSAVVATATSLGLERGFSDLIFGLAVVYACIIMYDAQGVRKEVGTHAKTLNRVLLLETSTTTNNQLRSSISISRDDDDDDDDDEEVGPGGGGDLVNDCIPPGKAPFIDHPPSSSENGFKPRNILMTTSDNTNKGVNLETSLVMTSGRLAADVAVDDDYDNVASSSSSSSKSKSKSNCYSTQPLHRPLNESVGHTLTEVIAGALLGFFVSLAVSTTI